MPDWEVYYASTADRAEIDFILKKGSRVVAVECKADKSPQLAKGFYTLQETLKIKEAYVACPIQGRFPLNLTTSAVGISELIRVLRKKVLPRKLKV